MAASLSLRLCLSNGAERKESAGKCLVNCEMLAHSHSLGYNLVVVLTDEAPHLAGGGNWVPVLEVPPGLQEGEWGLPPSGSPLETQMI